MAWRMPRSKATQHMSRIVGEVLLAAAGLPDPLVRAVPRVAEPVQQGGGALPVVVAEDTADLAGLGQGEDGLAVDVHLQLVGRAVAHTHRGGCLPALQVSEDLFGQVRVAVDPVHDLQGFAVGRAAVPQAVFEPAAEGARFFGEAEIEHGAHREEASRTQV